MIKIAKAFGKMQKHISLLLIEDNPDHAEIIKGMLDENKKVQLIVKHVKRLSPGLSSLAKEKYDVVILDLFLPDSRGLKGFISVHAEAINVPIIVLSVVDDEGFVVKALKLGAQDYLVKGQINSNLLWYSILSAIERKKIEKGC